MMSQTMVRRCLIVGCSRTKTDSPGLLPAVQRYDGPIYRVIRRYLREAPSAQRSLEIFVLSAEFGLIPGEAEIPAYDRLMTASRADELRPQVLNTTRDRISPQGYSEIFLSMSKTYSRALAGINDLVHDDTKVVLSSEPSGRQLTKLKQWLWGLEEPPPAQEFAWSDNGFADSESADSVPLVQRKTIPRTVVLRDHQMRMTAAEAISRLKQGMCEDPDTARKIRSWYLSIEGERISPKWAAQYLFGVPVSRFSADEARRALRGLGLNCDKV